MRTAVAERRRRFTPAEREQGLLVTVRLEYRRPGKSATSVGSGEYSFPWRLLPASAALTLLVRAIDAAMQRVGAAPVWAPSGTPDGEFVHDTRPKAWLEPAEPSDARQGALFQETP